MLRAPGSCDLQLLNSAGEPIAHTLELAEIE
jgi:hypothetical protein